MGHIIRQSNAQGDSSVFFHWKALLKFGLFDHYRNVYVQTEQFVVQNKKYIETRLGEEDFVCDTLNILVSPTKWLNDTTIHKWLDVLENYQLARHDELRIYCTQSWLLTSYTADCKTEQ